MYTPLPFAHVFLGSGSLIHLPSHFIYHDSTHRQQNEALEPNAAIANFHVTLVSENNLHKIL